MPDTPVIASINGTMLTPGVSRNRRLYTPALIEKTVNRMRARISDPAGLPIVMRTHHGAGDDSRLIVGRVRDVRLDESGNARYSADIYDTQPGRDIATLTTPGNPALRSVSIHGYWLGPVKRVQHEDMTVDTAEDLEIDAVDFTASPGVAGAVLDLGVPQQPRESVMERTPISESMEATVAAVEETAPEPSVVEAKDPKKPYGDVQYADPGYQADKKKRYPLDTEDHIRAAWSYINQKDNAAKYSSKQVARIKGRIKAAMKRIGAKLSDETIGTPRFGEVREYYPDGPDGQAGFCVDAYNGPLSITLRACGIDPGELRVITQAAMSAACDALQAMDPDMDADIDVDGAPNADSDGDMGKGESVQISRDGLLAYNEISAPTENPGSRTLNQFRVDAGLPPSAPGDTATLTVERGHQHEPDKPPTGAGAVSSPAPLTTESTPATGDSTNTEEVPAVSEAQQTAPGTAATTRALTDEDMKALAAVIGAALKESLEPVATRLAEAAKPPAPVVEKSENAPETAESTTPKADHGQSLKDIAEQLRAELAAERQKIVAEVREQVIKERGLPSRKGYRVHENDRQEPDPAAMWEDRANLVLGDYGKTPTPTPGTGTAPAPTGPAAGVNA